MDLRMSANKIKEYLDKARTARLATVNLKGKPHVVPVWFYYDGETIFLGTPSSSKKVRNIKENDRVALVADSGESYQDIKGVLIDGKASLVPKEDALRIMNSVIPKFMKKYFGSVEHPMAKQVMERHRREGVLIRITPEKISSWDYSKMT